MRCQSPWQDWKKSRLSPAFETQSDSRLSVHPWDQHSWTGVISPKPFHISGPPRKMGAGKGFSAAVACDTGGSCCPAGQREQGLPWAQSGLPCLSLESLGLSQSGSRSFWEHLLWVQTWESVLNFPPFYRLFITQNKKSVNVLGLALSTCHTALSLRLTLSHLSISFLFYKIGIVSNNTYLMVVL